MVEVPKRVWYSSYQWFGVIGKIQFHDLMNKRNTIGCEFLKRSADNNNENAVQTH